MEEVVMKFLVVSDSHGCLDNLKYLAAKLKREGITHAFHLGDDYDDALALIDSGMDVFRVPGVFSPYYKDTTVPNRLVVELDGKKFMLTHTQKPHENDLDEDADPTDMAQAEHPEIVFYGHTHLPAVEHRDGVTWVNPGHLKVEDKKGSPASYALVDTDADPVKVQILALEDDRVLMES
jgi:putative phosphoesterase